MWGHRGRNCAAPQSFLHPWPVCQSQLLPQLCSSSSSSNEDRPPNLKCCWCCCLHGNAEVIPPSLLKAMKGQVSGAGAASSSKHTRFNQNICFISSQQIEICDSNSWRRGTSCCSGRSSSSWCCSVFSVDNMEECMIFFANVCFLWNI